MKYLKLLISLAFMIGISMQAWANPAPPTLPVKQNIGMPDTTLDLKDSDSCQLCHNVDSEYIKVTHHLTAIDEVNGRVNESSYTTFFNGSSACSGCHIRALNLDDFEYFYPSRTCVGCHARNDDFHHQTERAQQGSCFTCHGGLVRGIDVKTLEGKRPDINNIGETVNFSITPNNLYTKRYEPYASNKPNPAYDMTNEAGTSYGNCNFCHDSAINSTEPYTLSDGTVLQTNGSTNSQTHHKTSFFEEGKCTWCHNLSMETNERTTLVCQRCHDKTTLHSIEFDAVGDGLQTGNEATAYLGHVGRPENCIGCHGDNGDRVDVLSDYAENSRFSAEMANIKVQALTPTLTKLSSQIVDFYSNTLIRAEGVSFINTYVMGTNFSSKVHLTDKKGNVTVIEPNEQSYNTLDFTVPKAQPVGYYNVTIHKYNESIDKPMRHSAPISLVVKPKIVLFQAFNYDYPGYNPLVILSGVSLGNAAQTLYQENSGYSIVDSKTGKKGYILFWKDGLVVASFNEHPDEIIITNLVDEKTTILNKIYLR